jgi:hypothetical protein
MKKRSGAVTAVYTIVDAFKLFFINDILDIIVLQKNNYARRYFDQQNQRQFNADTHHSKLIKWKELDRIELEAFLGLLIQAGVSHTNHQSVEELWNIGKNLSYISCNGVIKTFSTSPKVHAI